MPAINHQKSTTGNTAQWHCTPHGAPRYSLITTLRKQRLTSHKNTTAVTEKYADAWRDPFIDWLYTV